MECYSLLSSGQPVSLERLLLQLLANNLGQAKPAEETPGALKVQTWVLKVSIHCEGCKKKVKKVLRGIDGVYMTEIDSQLRKVIVTCNVDAETLIKRLMRSGKHAELWPEKVEKEEKPGKSKKNDKQKEPKDGEEVGDDGDRNLAAKPEQEAENGGNQPLEVDNMASHENEGTGGENGSGQNGGKKNKKKGKKGNSSNGGSDTNNQGELPADPQSAVATTLDSAPPMASMYHSPAFQPPYPYPAMYYTPPLFGVSCTTVYPSTSTSYYAPSMHAISYPPPPPPPNPIGNPSEDDYDEDEVGCSIM